MHERIIRGTASAPVYGDPRLPQRFWEKVFPEPNTGCWLWGASEAWTGYSRYKLGVNRETTGHRHAYLNLVGPIGDGLVLDHLCRTRSCVNSAHLDPVTQRENVRRSPVAIGAVNANKTHCPAGHEYTPENTSGRRYQRVCKRCRAERHAKRMASEPSYAASVRAAGARSERKRRARLAEQRGI